MERHFKTTKELETKTGVKINPKWKKKLKGKVLGITFLQDNMKDGLK